MVTKTKTAVLVGIDAHIIDIEVDIRNAQLPGFIIGGLPDKTVQESKERIVSAIRNDGFDWPRKKIIVNLAPAHIPKTGTGLDLAIALTILSASEQVVFDPEKFVFLGELALDGKLRPVSGALATALTAKGRGIPSIIVPSQNANEASIVDGVSVIGARSLREIVEYLKDERRIDRTVFRARETVEETELDLREIKGQESAKRALIISAAGGHALLMKGSPGSGKSMLARALRGILPNNSLDDAIEVTKIYSALHLLDPDAPLIMTPPYRSPHHTTPTIAMIGGGKPVQPGEVTLAHNGVLFIDEFAQASPWTIDSLREPMEAKKVVISRLGMSVTFPANFLLVAAMNPCKCGWYGDTSRECTCPPSSVEQYQKRISGPILDRFDMVIQVPKVSIEDMTSLPQGVTTHEARLIVEEARNRQKRRYEKSGITSNASASQNMLLETFPFSRTGLDLLARAASKFQLSARGYTKVMKVAATIADIAGDAEVSELHIGEALQYRVSPQQH